MTAWHLWRLRIFSRTGAPSSDAARHAEEHEHEVTLPAFVVAPSQRVLRAGLLVLLTLAAGWTDALCYLAVGRVFASFMTGNILFIGISIAQGNIALLVRACTALLLFLVSITLGTLYLQELPALQRAGIWRSTLAWYLLGEGLILLAFALVWLLAGNLVQQLAVQVVLLGIAAFGMGLQAALLGAFNILDVNTVALTGTELLLGIRLAQRIGRQSVDHPDVTGAPFLVTWMLSYTLAALAVALTLAVPWIGAAFIPFLLVMGATLVVLVTPEQEADQVVSSPQG
jgi:uncharacterized membrane protein YoaK (UPF0700 family)